MNVNVNDIDIKTFLQDHKMGHEWFCEPYTKAKFDDGSMEFIVDGCYRYIHCLRISQTRMPFESCICVER